MSDEIKVDPIALEQEILSLRERIEDLEQFKRLATKLGKVPPSSQQETAVATNASPPEKSTNPITPAIPPTSTVHHPFDGTVAGLVQVYRTHPKSPYHALKFAVRANYDGVLNRLVAGIGATRIADLDKEKVQHLYEGWMATGKVAMAYAFIGRLRLIFSFGMTVLDDPACIRISSIMHTMRFTLPKKRVERLTAAHVAAIRDTAHDLDWHSIALAQVFQFELKLRQLDVIGEWVPLAEPGESDITIDGLKWLRGLRWEYIDENLVLRHVIKDQLGKMKEVTHDLKQFPLIMEELDWFGTRPTKGPLICCEFKSAPTDRPYTHTEYRRKWRIVASKAEIPKDIRNSDSFRGEDLKGKPEATTPLREERLH
jgi:hypothetical protein